MFALNIQLILLELISRIYNFLPILKTTLFLFKYSNSSIFTIYNVIILL